MAAPRLKNQNRVRRYRQNPNRAQVGTKKTTQETLMLQRHFTEPPSLNRTAVIIVRRQFKLSIHDRRAWSAAQAPFLREVRSAMCATRERRTIRLICVWR